MMAFDAEPVRSVERIATPRGELALLQRGPHFEIVSNGTFLMDTRDGRSERLLVRAALAARAAPTPKVLIGGLGVGFSLAEAVGHDTVAEITVVEIEPAVIAWQRAHLSAYADHAADDPRVALVCADLVRWLDEPGPDYDAICLDIDNGPQWTVTDDNRPLYSDAGLERLRGRLTEGGVLAVWSASRSRHFEARLRRHFAAIDIHEVPVSRGEPDVVYIGR
jgi:spermidine synthase